MVYLTCAVIGLRWLGVIKTWTEVAARVRLYMLTSDLTSLVPPQFSYWLQVRKVGTVYFFLFLQEPITYFYYYFFLTGMNWKLHSIVHGQIHLATQFTNGVKWHFQNSPLEAGFLVVKEKKNETPPPIPRKNYRTRS